MSVTALSTVSRGPAEVSGLPARATSLGVRHVALDAGQREATLGPLLPALLAAGLEVVAVEAPCPRPPGGRPPFLATEDREERLAAVRAFEGTLATAARVGARLVIVQLGTLPVQHGWQETTRAYARRTLDEEALERLVEQRRRMTPRALDLARFALDPVLARADAAGVTVGLVNRARWFEVPTAAEAATLLGELRGAPLLPFYDAAAAHVRAALGLGAGRPALELEQACGAFLTDAAGLRGGLPWGTGEIDRAAVLARLPGTAVRVLRSALASDEEIRAALAGR